MKLLPNVFPLESGHVSKAHEKMSVERDLLHLFCNMVVSQNRGDSNIDTNLEYSSLMAPPKMVPLTLGTLPKDPLTLELPGGHVPLQRHLRSCMRLGGRFGV